MDPADRGPEVNPDVNAAADAPSPEVVIVTMAFDAIDVEALAGVLAKYVVLCRGEDGCRNVDLARSATTSDRFVVIEKWASPAAQRAHFDSSVMTEMAAAAVPLLAAPPAIDLLDTISAHDLI